MGTLTIIYWHIRLKCIIYLNKERIVLYFLHNFNFSNHMILYLWADCWFISVTHLCKYIFPTNSTQDIRMSLWMCMIWMYIYVHVCAYNNVCQKCTSIFINILYLSLYTHTVVYIYGRYIYKYLLHAYLCVWFLCYLVSICIVNKILISIQGLKYVGIRFLSITHSFEHSQRRLKGHLNAI